MVEMTSPPTPTDSDGLVNLEALEIVMGGLHDKNQTRPPALHLELSCYVSYACHALLHSIGKR
jgi:hypothetical protein